MKINDEIKIDFHVDHYDSHKKKFEYKTTFIRNLRFDQNTFDDNKQDFVDFYQKKQKEAEDGQKICDHILHTIIDENIIDKSELPGDVANHIGS